MNSNIEKLMKQNFDGFKKSVELGIINKDIACDAVIESKNMENIYNWAKDIKDANIEKLEDAIIQGGEAKWIYLFAKNIKGANIKKLEDAIIQIENAEYVYIFTRDIKEANVEKLGLFYDGIDNYAIYLLFC